MPAHEQVLQWLEFCWTGWFCEGLLGEIECFCHFTTARLWIAMRAGVLDASPWENRRRHSALSKHSHCQPLQPVEQSDPNHVWVMSTICSVHAPAAIIRSKCAVSTGTHLDILFNLEIHIILERQCQQSQHMCLSLSNSIVFVQAWAMTDHLTCLFGSHTSSSLIFPVNVDSVLTPAAQRLCWTGYLQKNWFNCGC